MIHSLLVFLIAVGAVFNRFIRDWLKSRSRNTDPYQMARRIRKRKIIVCCQEDSELLLLTKFSPSESRNQLSIQILSIRLSFATKPLRSSSFIIFRRTLKNNNLDWTAEKDPKPRNGEGPDGNEKGLGAAVEFWKFHNDAYASRLCWKKHQEWHYTPIRK